MHDYWKQVQEELESHPAGAIKPSTSGAFPADESATTLESTFDCHCCELLEKAAHENNDSLGWAAELCHYLGVIIENVSKDMDVIVWWEKHAQIYPTLACIAQDVCAVPASSVPCERLFSAGAEIATDRHSCLGSGRFEELQVLKHAWNHTLIDCAGMNSDNIEDVNIEDFKELLEWDKELMNDLNNNVDIVMM
ncbi:hypothetical protein SCLCIDRAFT_120139 [Scleroderma citrinum Foug A]|uniref:HAT C-terminal dimerisation domain-containing protein n=1 Tax=Scleroderma citrinum Foug A TaxID=1036808 RepID=A0A0C3DNM6_9AGAM|nr:hypothetical protein SCLCIDRAFT_120139 [Scleroderma citrinum Foug A]